MRILVAEDDPVTSKIVESTLKRLGWDVITAADGSAAWKILEELKGDNAPDLLVIDWMMPGMEGIEICRRIRNTPAFELMYVILLTSRDAKEDLAMGLIAGANDYITKPFHALEIEARVRVGERMVKLQKSLAARISELEEALTHVRRLQGLLPICSYCKKVRNETNYWQQVDSYLVSHTEVELTHSVCPDCTAKIMQEVSEEVPDARRQSEGTTTADPKPNALRKINILVAEDNLVNQKLALGILQRAGYRPVIVGNGREAVAALEQRPFDLVLMDIQMPVMGGFEATRLIRELDTTLGRHTPIIALTTRTMKGDREACLAAGMDAFASKPIQAKALLLLIEQLAPGRGIIEPSVNPTLENGDLDESAFLTSIGGDRALAMELVEIFLEELPPRLREIRSAVGEGDCVRLGFSAHALKGSAGAITARRVAAAAGSLETIAGSEQLDGAANALSVLEGHVDRLRERLLAMTGGR